MQWMEGRRERFPLLWTYNLWNGRKALLWQSGTLTTSSRLCRPPLLERLRHSIEASMPPECQACVLCGDDPTYIGAGMVDGIRIGYHLCARC